jgi:diguanylate cyclase (GGDEF)-like protein
MPKDSKEEIGLLLEGSRRAIPFNIILASLLAFDLYYIKAPKLIITTWIIAIIFLSIIRYCYCYYFAQRKESYKAQGDSILINFVLLTSLTGGVWGACYWLMMPYVSELHEFIIILVFGGMCAGSIASLSVYLPAYYAYVLPMFLPVIVYNYWLASMDRSILASMFLLFVIMIFLSAKINNRNLTQIIQLSKENDLLINNLKHQSITDSLTNLYNRRHFTTLIKEEVNRAKRNHYSLSLVMMDIDNFKLVNDSFGHPYGDKVLITIAHQLEKLFRRGSDAVFRLGGDEFAVILPSQSIEDVEKRCNKVNTQLRGCFSNINDQAEKEVLQKISMSIGLASIPINHDADYEKLVIAADEALYQAKNKGKNQLVITYL